MDIYWQGKFSLDNRDINFALCLKVFAMYKQVDVREFQPEIDR